MPESRLKHSKPTAESNPAAFATTRWSVIFRASSHEDPSAKRNLEDICRACWYPIYSFIRRMGHSPEDAQDLAQGFFQHLLSHNILAHADPSRGRFRSFLLGSLRHYISNETRKERAVKRGGRMAFVSLEIEDGEERFERDLAHPDTPEKHFERCWAENLLERATNALHQDYARQGKEKLFKALQPFLAGAADANCYRDLAATLNMSSGTVAVAVFRMRKRYGELLREEIAQTVEDPADIESEIRLLVQAVAS